MGNIAADTVYEVSYRSSWGTTEGEPLGHLVIRRLDDHEVIAEIPVRTEVEARELIDRAEREVRGPVEAFEQAWDIRPDVAADPGPDVWLPVGASAEPDSAPRRGDRIIGADPRIVVFPDPAEVFAVDQPWLARLLHPLVSIELSAIDPDWRGRVHLLSPIEPLDGLLGENTVEYHDAHACQNWISFQVESDGHYRFLGDRRFFEFEAENAASASHPDRVGGLSLAYAEADAEFAASRARWDRLGRLVWGSPDDPARQREGWGTNIAVLEALGGEPEEGNWTAFDPPVGMSLDRGAPGAPTPRLADGSPFVFVASTAGYPWREQGADAIMLFFEPNTRTALLTFDWT